MLKENVNGRFRTDMDKEPNYLISYFQLGGSNGRLNKLLGGGGGVGGAEAVATGDV